MVWGGFRGSRSCSRDTHPESCITEYTQSTKIISVIERRGALLYSNLELVQIRISSALSERRTETRDPKLCVGDKTLETLTLIETFRSQSAQVTTDALRLLTQSCKLSSDDVFQETSARYRAVEPGLRCEERGFEPSQSFGMKSAANKMLLLSGASGTVCAQVTTGALRLLTPRVALRHPRWPRC